MEKLEISNTKKRILASSSCLDESRYIDCSLQRLYFEDINMSGTKFTDANLSGIEIENAQLGGAYIHNIGLPPEGHPAYKHDAKQLPLRFEHCNLSNSLITNCDLSGVEIFGCNLTGMKINGIAVEDLLKDYQQ